MSIATCDASAFERTVTQYASRDLTSTLAFLGNEGSRGMQRDTIGVPAEFASSRPTTMTPIINRDLRKSWPVHPIHRDLRVLTPHPQRRDAVVAMAMTPPAVTYPFSSSLASPTAAELEPSDSALPDVQFSVIRPGVFGAVIAPGKMINLTELVRQGEFVSGFAADPGSGASVFLTNPFVCFVHGVPQPGFKVPDDTFNGARVFYNERHNALVVFICTQNGKIICAVRMLDRPTNEWYSKLVCGSDSVLPVSVNDIAVVPHAFGTQYVFTAVTDSDYVVTGVVEVDFPAPHSDVSAEDVIRTVFTHKVGIKTGLDADIADNDVMYANASTHDAHKFFTYCEYSNCGRYFAATNDRGRYVAVWTFGAMEADPGSLVEGVHLNLIWKHSIVASENGSAMPYKIVATALSCFAVQAGDLIIVVDPQTKSWDAVRPVTKMERRTLPALQTSTSGELIGLSPSPFGGRHLFCATDDHIARVSLAEGKFRAPHNGTLKENCLAFIRNHAGNFEMEELEMFGRGIDMFIDYCPRGHRVQAFEFAVSTDAVTGFAGVRPSCSTAHVRCSHCLATPPASVRVHCPSCAYTLCQDCTSTLTFVQSHASGTKSFAWASPMAVID